MTHPADFQTIIMKLQQFWADQGCVIWQPYYSQVGAGTMNPATFLRVLGPEPWNVAYVEPSVRPDDGRYGENPNRFQLHYQFQVILKPDPGNPQELYLKSLEAIGVDPRQHDIRFVEDNWEQPAISAWGLGWEVWLDGQEITQFTYFQQMGGVNLDPVSVEITYGLERILIALHNARAAWELPWNTEYQYGDIRRVEEFEHSKYYFEIGDVERLRQMYALFESEATACLEAGLVLPAHDYVLKCSHAFNVLDTRGAIGVTERQEFFRRMRELARRVAETYIEQRQRLEYPWLKETSDNAMPTEARALVSAFPQDTVVFPTQPAPFLLEIGVEELPAADLDSALEQLQTRLPVLLKELRLEHGAWRILGTPRRLVVHVEGLAPQQADLEEIIKGPPADRAFAADGTPTRAAEGFARSKGVAVSDLQVHELDGGRYCVAVVYQAGRPTPQVLLEALPGLLAGLRFEKTMRWNSTQVSFSRPVRWLLALYGETVIPFRYAGLIATNWTRGLRFHQPEGFVIGRVSDYFKQLSSQGILLDPAERRQLIAAQVAAIAAKVGGRIAADPALLGEVANLVEAPTTLLGSFEQTHLSLPREVLISVMKKHQRYFPVETSNAVLLPYFIAVRNGDDQGLDLVVQGNEHVVRARFADANFFVREDLKKPLEAYLPGLATTTFQTRLGSLLDKARRISALTADLILPAALNASEAVIARRAAELCKADLATQMVVEMTSLQGIMGRYYALHSGETEPVAQAIFEHYLPRFAGDATPSIRSGLVIGLADRLDTLVGLFAAGLAPTGNKDPFAQRRAALGLVQNLLAWDLDFDLRRAIAAAAVHLPIPASPESQAAVLEFIIERLRNVLLEAGGRYDVVDAVLAAQGVNPARARRSILALGQWVARPDWNVILPAFARCVRITRPISQRYAVNPEQFVETAEKELFAALVAAETTLSGGAPDPFSVAAATLSVDGLLNAFVPMIPSINTFFDQVLVMAEDLTVRANRLGLVQRIAGLAEGVADFSRLEGF